MAHSLQMAVALVLTYSCCCNATAAVYGEECGSNPMQQVLMVARRSGHTLTHVLEVLRKIDPPAFRTLAQKFRMYAACVGLVDTGYFKKRSSMPSLLEEPARDFHRSQSRSVLSAEDEDYLPQEFASWLKKYSSSSASENSAYGSAREFGGSVDRFGDDLLELIHDEYPKRTQPITEQEHKELLSDFSDLRPFFVWK
ncbi:hypothetical protein CAPTEDRAFT_191851 [Capitella teleta]|uniref:Uncharacterized protein n=1 Tax=Capitella teleta TaxID=283909 RepID=R7U6P9_CAPTE|nr:hypothetical protein CAPTEDRAFT_191851 [Capitella teleta]|eukprot:ELT98795.1 hypothetical protein CAPTEDRAFT_191851 [Capitella teleta]